jgi:hypothetical protein
MKSILDDIIEAINPNNPSYSKVMPIKAIHFDKAIQTATVKKYSIEEGEFVYVDENGQLQDCPNKNAANYCITSCWGNVNNTELYFNAIHVKTLQLIKIPVKSIL